jgi:hypothetical protein
MTGAATGAGAATAGVGAAVDFLVVFLGAVAELDICISVIEEVFGAYKRGNDDGVRVSEALNFVRSPGEKVSFCSMSGIYFSRRSHTFLHPPR